jgi:pimeloyl-ACP methyl ester carboxylesterase
MMPRDNAFEVRGLKIHYVEWGERQATPLVLVHGFLDHARSWDPFVAAVQKHSSRPLWIVAPDCRGHGDSGWVGAGGYYHFPDYLLDLDFLIGRLGVKSAHLLGHSMGGTISLLYAGTLPHRVDRLVLVEGIGPIGMMFSDAPQRTERWLAEVKSLEQSKPREYASLDEAARRLRRSNPRLQPDLALHLARHGMRRTAGRKWTWKFDPLHRTTSPQPFYSGQAIAFLRRIQCPVLLIQGKQTRQTPRPDFQQRIEALSDANFAEIDAAGHMVHHDNPEHLAKSVVEFLHFDRAERPTAEIIKRAR